MAVHCSDDCRIVCDFCVHFHAERDEDGIMTGGAGLCDATGKRTEAGGGCEEHFHCFWVTKEESNHA